MRTNRSDLRVGKTIQHDGPSGQHDGPSEPPVLPLKPVGIRPEKPPELRPLDWNLSVSAAKARLNEQSLAPDTMDHPLMADQVMWLAALLCAYGKPADREDRKEPPAKDPPVA